MNFLITCTAISLVRCYAIAKNKVGIASASKHNNARSQFRYQFSGSQDKSQNCFFERGLLRAQESTSRSSHAIFACEIDWTSGFTED